MILPTPQNLERIAIWLEKQRAWLKWEEKAEKDRIQKELGNFRRLGLFRLVDLEPGNMGKQFARFSPALGNRLPAAILARMIEPGSLFVVKPEGKSGPDFETPLGIVNGVDGNVVTLAVPWNWDPPDEVTFRLEPTENPWVNQQIDLRLNGLIQSIRNLRFEHPPIVSHLLGNQVKLPKNPWKHRTIPELNPSQNKALEKVGENQPITMIQGPPGTGKTTTLAHLIQSLASQGKRVLVAASSNLAVDNLVEKCLALRVDCLRMGHPSRVHPAVQSACLDSRIKESPDYRNALQFRKDARAERSAAKKWTRSKPLPGEKRSHFQEAKALEVEADRLEDLAREKLLDDTPAIFSTLHSFVGKWAGKRFWDWLVVDEAAQAMESSIWPLLSHGSHLVLAGDPCQLPPTVLSQDAEKEGAAISLMERLSLEYPERLEMLTTQYRMSGPIMEFPSWDRYEGKLDAPDWVLERALPVKMEIPEEWLSANAILAIDTAGSGWSEETRENSSSLFNPGESKLVGALARKMIEGGLQPSDIGIITPYRAQAEQIENEPGLEGVEIDSVDSFQGREKEAIIISMTRSNDRGEIGFLAETRRIHVAITRARAFLGVVGDLSTLASHPYYQKLLDHWTEKGFLKSVWDEEVAAIIS